MIKFDVYNKKIHSNLLGIHADLTGESKFKNQYKCLLFYSNNKFVGYTVFKLNTKSAFIDWFYAPNFGKDCIKVLNNYFISHNGAV